MRRKPLLLTCILGMAAAAAAAQTNVSGTLTSSTEWTLGGSPYIAVHGFSIAGGVTLTIDAGVVVELGGGQSVQVGGSLIATGTSGSPVVLTSTTGTSSSLWSSINFNSNSSGQLNFVTVSYGGSSNSSTAGAIEVNSGAGSVVLDNVTVSGSGSSGIYLYGTTSALTLSNSTISDNAYYGVILLNGAAASVSSTSFAGNGSYAISVDGGCSLPVLSALSVSSNGGGTKNGIEYRGGAITTAQTWQAALDWYMTAAPSVAGSGALTIAAGATVHLSSSENLNVSGILSAVGTSASPITFTSFSGTIPGSWGAINFNNGSSGHLSYVNVDYGGAGGSATNGAITVDGGTGGSINFDNLNVNASASSGIELYGTAAMLGLSSAAIAGSAYYGVILINGASANIVSTSFSNNGGYALSVDGGSTLTGLAGLSASGNGGGTKNGIEYRGGAIGTETWLPGLDWYMSASPSTTGTSTLTLGAGVTLHFAAGQNMTIAGNLTAVGSSGSPITFTSFTSTSPGSWGAIIFNNGSSGCLSNVTVSYGGAGGYSTTGAINVNGGAGGSIALDNLTIQASGSSGIVVNGASAAVTLASSTITGSAYNGLFLLNGGSASVAESTFTNNGSYPISTAAGCPLSGLTAVTLSGNGSGGARNGVEHRGGTVVSPQSESWAPGLPWYLTGGVGVNSGARLTWPAGLTVNLANGVSVSLGGTFSAVGTAAAPITLVPLSTSPSPGIWNGITFNSGAAGEVAYTTIPFAGVQVSWAAPVFDHVTVANAPGYGFSVAGPPTPVINNCSLIGNVRGVNANSSVPVDARLTYWGAPSGPSGEGPGTGASVSASVLFEPWLVAAPSTPQYFSSFAQTDRTFNPAIGTRMTLTFTTPLSGTPSALIKNAGGAVVRTFTSSGAVATFAWDGTSDAGIAQPAGTYGYEIDSTSSGGAAATSAVGSVILDPTRQLTLSGIAVSPSYFSPNGDGVQDTVTVTGSVNFDDGWTVAVINSAGAVIRTTSGTGGVIAWTWNGLDGNGVLAPDGVYTLEVTATAGTSTMSATGIVTLDNTPPAVAITSPTGGQLLANVHQAGSAVVPVMGSVSDVNLASWVLEYSTSGSPNTWLTIQTGTASTSGLLVNWNTLLANGAYNLRLAATDRAGNVSQQTVLLTLGNFSASESALLVSAVRSVSVTYTSSIPFAAIETLQIKNAAGTVVRTLLNAVARNAGIYQDTWNGLGDSGNLLPDGPYFYVVNVSDGVGTMTWDLTNQYLNNSFLYNDSLNLPGYNPFNNAPMTVAYNFGSPGMVTIAVGPGVYVADNCSPPQYCILKHQYDDGGAHTITWAGVDQTGSFLPNIISIAAVSERSQFSANAVVSSGTLPQIATLNVVPAVFGPAAGTQNVGFVLSTYQSKPANIIVMFENQASLSVLRTISETGIAPGIVTVPWDGTADNGMMVSPGFYTITVTVTDPIGNQVSSQILTNVEY
jgi:flagellar hook assembly protein FlgD